MTPNNPSNPSGPAAEGVKDRPSVIRAWCMYDWANSVYNLCITTAIFPIYYSSLSAAVSAQNGWTRPVANSLGQAS